MVLGIMVCELKKRRVPFARAHRCQFWGWLSPQANFHWAGVLCVGTFVLVRGGGDTGGCGSGWR